MTREQVATLSNDQLLAGLGRDFEDERRASHCALIKLCVIERRRLFAARGYSNMFTFLIGYYRQSEPSAGQRLKALQLMTDVPEAEESYSNGDLNLSTMAMAQRQILREEKVTGKKVSKEKKKEIVEKIPSQTMQQAEKELLRLLPESATEPKTVERRVSENASRVSLTLPDSVRDKLLRLKDLWAHVDQQMDYIQIIDRMADIALEKVDPVRKETRSAARKRSAPQSATESEVKSAPASTETRSRIKVRVKRRTHYTAAEKKDVWGKAGSQCEYVDEETGQRCSCTFGLEIDHVTPLALGGADAVSNMRLLCRAHNQLLARRHFGNEKIDREISRTRRH